MQCGVRREHGPRLYFQVVLAAMLLRLEVSKIEAGETASDPVEVFAETWLALWVKLPSLARLPCHRSVRVSYFDLVARQ